LCFCSSSPAQLNKSNVKRYESQLTIHLLRLEFLFDRVVQVLDELYGVWMISVKPLLASVEIVWHQVLLLLSFDGIWRTNIPISNGFAVSLEIGILTLFEITNQFFVFF
jgi:hypothetical protein